MGVDLFIWLFFGFLGGLLGGLLGIGGGIVFALVLPFGLAKNGIPATEIVSYTIANSLFGTFFTTLSANLVQWREVFHLRKQILLTGFFASASTFLLLHYFVNSGLYSRKFFEAIFSLILVYMMVRLFWSIRGKTNDVKAPLVVRARWYQLALSGFFAGMVSPLTGMGGGIVLVPILRTMLHSSLESARLLSLGVISISSFVAMLINMVPKNGHPETHFSMGILVGPLAVPLALGGMVGSFIGLRVGKKMSVFWTTFLFGLFLFISLVLLQFRAFFQ